MKQADQLAVPPMLTDAFSWADKVRFSREYGKSVRRRITEKFEGYRQRFYSLCLVMAVGGVFLAGSYLFFIQLARYGW